MMISDARIAANRRNALRSTGPSSDEGKAASRRNSLKHGLTASIVATEDPQILAKRTSAIARAVKPEGDWEKWLCDEVATITLRLDRIKAVERKLRDVVAFRAGTVWDDDRRVEVETLAAGLSANPPRVVSRLRLTPIGCDWLIERWAFLARLANLTENEDGECWTSDQRRLAFDLAGTPLEARPETFGSNRLAQEFAHLEMAELQAQRDRVEETDRVDRALTEAGLTDDSTAELRRVRRYETTLHKRMHWCLDQLKGSTTDRRPSPDPRPASETRGQPSANLTVQATPSPEPRTPTGREAQVNPPPAEPPPTRTRVEAKLQQAEARRASKVRKLERRRA